MAFATASGACSAAAAAPAYSSDVFVLILPLLVLLRLLFIQLFLLLLVPLRLLLAVAVAAVACCLQQWLKNFHDTTGAAGGYDPIERRSKGRGGAKYGGAAAGRSGFLLVKGVCISFQL